jgi:hypothetical protein
MVCTNVRVKVRLGVPQAVATAPRQRWSMNFTSE